MCIDFQSKVPNVVNGKFVFESRQRADLRSVSVKTSATVPPKGGGLSTFMTQS